MKEIGEAADGGRLTEAAIDRFRRQVCSDIVDYLKTVEPARQLQTLNEMLDLMPDPGSKGALFTEFRRSYFEDLLGVEVEPAKGFKVDNVTRYPDDVIEISVTEEGLPPPGRYAVDDKAGPEAFKIEQARAYAKMLKETGNEYDGFIYICSDATDAERVADAIKKDVKIKEMGMADKFIVTHFKPDTGEWVKL